MYVSPQDMEGYGHAYSCVRQNNNFPGVACRLVLQSLVLFILCLFLPHISTGNIGN